MFLSSAIFILFNCLTLYSTNCLSNLTRFMNMPLRDIYHTKSTLSVKVSISVAINERQSMELLQVNTSQSTIKSYRSPRCGPWNICCLWQVQYNLMSISTKRFLPCNISQGQWQQLLAAPKKLNPKSLTSCCRTPLKITLEGLIFILPVKPLILCSE